MTGFVFQQRDKGQLLECVSRFLQMGNEERRQMGLAGRRKMEREFDREIVVQAYMEELESRGKNG